MSGTKLSPDELALQFCALNPEDFQRFWSSVLFEWDQEDGDLEASWFYNGRSVRPSVLTVISAMHSAVASGHKAARK